MLEPYDGKLSRTVLRREGGGNTADPADYTEEYFKGLTAEKKVVRFVKGRLKEYWEIKDKEHKRNEPLDLRNYATAALAISRPVLKKTDADGTTVQPVKKARGRRQLSGGI